MMALWLVFGLAADAGAAVRIRPVPARLVPPAAAASGAGAGPRVSLSPGLGSISPAAVSARPVLGGARVSVSPAAAAALTDSTARVLPAAVAGRAVAAVAETVRPGARAVRASLGVRSAGAAQGRSAGGLLAKAAGELDGPGDFRPASADGSPSLDALFDGVELRSGLAGPRLRSDGGKAQFLGGGNFGAVYRTPKQKGLVYKVLAPGADAFLFGTQTYPALAREEHEISEALGRSGTGPRYYGSRVLGGYWVYAKAEIAGDTVEKLIRERRFAEAERDLVLALLDRMADARVRVDDMRPPNIMIGTTADDPERKAYLIDGTKERVEGDRVPGLIERRGGFGPAERALVEELFARYGEAALEGPRDARLARVMIGATQRDPRRRAYFVDSGGFLPLAPEPGMSRGEFRAFLESQLVVKGVIQQGNPFTAEPVFVSLRGMLDEGVRRSKQTGFWEKLWTALGDLLANANFPAK